MEMHMDCSIEIFDVRDHYPLKTGKTLSYPRPVEAKKAFETFRSLYSVNAGECAFVVGLDFDASLADQFFISEKGFEAIAAEAPASSLHYKELRKELPPLTIAEQRNLRDIYRQLGSSNPDRSYDDSTVIEEMVLESSSVSSGFVRCSNCNLPMHVENIDDHTCYRCGKKLLCSYCMTSHACKG